MARFSDAYPYAYHAFPLHAARSIWRSGELLSKAQSPIRRASTGNVDQLLGFADYVHLYLPRRDTRAQDLPIVRTQLKPSKVPPFPHAVLRLDTTELSDEQCTICCWNIAVSRPKAGGLRGGNWTRGTRGSRIRDHWRTFRAESPVLKRARGYWHAPFEVPVLKGQEIANNLSLLKTARCPELLLRSPLSLGDGMDLLVFSVRDRELLEILEDGPDLEVSLLSFSDYEGPPKHVARSIADHFRGGPLLRMDFDRRR